MGMLRKLLLCAVFFSNEAGIYFEQLYAIPVLQMLGLPLRLASITAVVYGPAASMLVPALGWLSDKGSNPIRRKRVGLSFATGLMVIGLSCVIVPNVIHIGSQIDCVRLYNASSCAAWNSTDTAAWSLWNDSCTETLTAAEGCENIFVNSTIPVVSNDTLSTTRVVPFSAWLAWLGFIVYDVGYDGSYLFVRACMLACSPRAEHTSMLVLGSVMAAAGGISFAAAGMVDFTSFLQTILPPGVNPEPDVLAVQTSVHAGFIVFLLMTGFVVTLLASLGLRASGNSSNDSDVPDTTTEVAASKDPKLCETDGNLSQCKTVTANALPSSPTICAMPMFSEASLTSSETLSNGQISLKRDNQQEFGSGKTRNVKGLAPSEIQATLQQSKSPDSLSESAPLVANQSSCKGRATLSTFCQLKTKLSTFRNQESQPSFAWGRLVICTSMLLACGASYMFSYMISDYVGKAVYGGNPWAETGSEGLISYMAGVQMATKGFLVVAVTYLVLNLVHTGVLKRLGHKVEFVLVHVILAGAMVLLAVCPRLEVFFFMCVVAGVQRACVFVVPYDAANNIAQAEAESGAVSGSPRVGLAMSLVSAMASLAYLVLFPWVGQLEEWTGVLSTPLWLGAAYSCLAALAFLVL